MAPKHPRRHCLRTPALLVAAVAAACAGLDAADWPMWRHDSGRGGASPEELPEKLQLQWVLALPAPRPAWPDNQPRLSYDRLYEPIVVGKRLFVGSMLRDKVTAFDTESGAEVWRFYAGGPVRFAPAAWKDRIFFVSDDGFLYCVRAADGELVWKFEGGPGGRWILGNERLVSAWPARGAPVVHEDVVYFGASIWPFMGTFLHALDAESGRVVWSNTGSGASYTQQQHDSPAFAGVSPHGYMAVSGDTLLVAGGRTVPAAFDRKTGKLIHFKVASRATGEKGGGGYEVVAGSNFFINRDYLYRLDNGDYIQKTSALISTPNAIIGHDADGIHAFRPGWEEEATVDRRGRTTRKIVLKTSFTTPIDFKLRKVYILSGTRLYATGAAGDLLAVDLPRLDRGARVSWRFEIPDEPLNMASGDGKLFVTTDAGRIYCFGSRAGEDIALPAASRVYLIPRGAAWRYHDGLTDIDADWKKTSYNDGEWREGKAPLGYGDRDRATVLEYGSDSRKKPVTTYYRHEFDVPADVGASEPIARVRVDDGAVFWLNGAEAARLYMPEGEIKADTLAEEGTDETSYVEVPLARDLLRPGRNVLAVEVHQRTADSSDIVLDLELEVRRSARVDERELLESRAGEHADLAAKILDRKGRGAGYAVALGIGSGRLIEEVLAGSALHVIAIDPDPARVDAFRRRMDEAGVYGRRVAAIVGEPLDGALPPYVAELVFAEDAAAVLRDGAVAELHRILRPTSGMACLALSDGEHAELARRAAGAHLDRGEVDRAGRLSVLRRAGEPTGAGDWTHQHGNAANTVTSTDRLVRAPLGLLWFGGPSNEEVLPRHGHGPTPHVVGGRVIIEGRHMLRATDAYTGRLLWQRELRDLGKFYDYSAHEPGANALGSNYVSLADGIYVLHGGACLRLDPATGETVSRFELSAGGEEGGTLSWGTLAIEDDVIVAAVEPLDLTPLEYVAKNFEGLRDDALRKTVALIDTWKDFTPIRKRLLQDDRDHFRDNVNKLLRSEGMVAKIPARVREEAKAEAIEKKLADYVDGAPDRTENDDEAIIIKRELLAAYYKLPKLDDKPQGTMTNLRGVGSKRLAGVHRGSGEKLWEVVAQHQIRHNAIALGGGKAFYLDRISASIESYYQRRGIEPEDRGAVVAVDLESGRSLWRNDKHVFGTWLGYSAEHDVLLQAGSLARDRAIDEVGRGLAAYRGATGELLWHKDERYNGPCLLLGDRIITQAQSATSPGFALDLRTGETILEPHPITGEETRWQYIRNYGCNTVVGCPGLLAFRSAAAGYYDLLSGSGTGNFGGFRSGCTSNLIPAGGILNAPDYTRDCTCAYQNQSSLALVHMPEVEAWTISGIRASAQAVRRLGVNLGAPGDRRDAEGTYWIDYPSVGGVSPDVEIETFSETFAYRRDHSTGVAGGAGGSLAWVAASAVEGDGELVIRLGGAAKPSIGNEVAGGAALETSGARTTAAVPVRALPAGAAGESGSANATSLSRVGGRTRFQARVDGQKTMATRSVTAELWVRPSADFTFLDARGASKDRKSGFVLDGRQARARYFTADAAGKDNADEVSLRAETRLADGKWAHVAFTYDAETGLGILWVDGKEAARHDGPDGRSLWWDDAAPALEVGRDLGRSCAIDELRIAGHALPPGAFLVAGLEKVDPAALLSWWRMESTPAGAKPYTVALVFAELDGLSRGERVFDIALQGRTVLEGFDIAAAAGGDGAAPDAMPACAIVREFHDIAVADHLRIRLIGREGRPPLLSGVKIIARSREF